MRPTLIRVISGYQTVSLDAAGLLARVPPLQFLVNARRRMYLRCRDLKEWRNYTPNEGKCIKEEETLLMERQWVIYLQRGGASGRRTIDAVAPSFREWLERRHGTLEFHMSQILTGHGSFGSYLFKIEKRDPDECPHCEGGLVDSPEHMVQECEAWAPKREELVRSLGQGLSLAEIVKKITSNREKWEAFRKFSREVMRSKEEFERELERREWYRPRSKEWIRRRGNNPEANREDSQSRLAVVMDGRAIGKADGLSFLARDKRGIVGHCRVSSLVMFHLRTERYRGVL